MTRAGQKIAGVIGTIRRRWLRRQLRLHGALALIGLFAWLLAMIVLDNVAMLSAGQLLAGWAVLAAIGLAWAIVVVQRGALRRPTPTHLALLYEARAPGRQNRLINSVQFLQSREAEHDPIACAAVYENAAALDPATAAQAIDTRPARRAVLALAVCGLILLVYGALRPAWTANALARVLVPFSPAPHLLATEPAVAPGDVELVEGARLTIEARVPAARAGYAADPAMLEYRIAELDWVRTIMQLAVALQTPTAGTEPGRYRYVFDSVRRPLTYRVRVGRSVSPIYHVSVQYRPRVEQLQVTINGPEYAGGATRVLKPNVGDISALQGSTVALHLTASTILASGQIELPDGTLAPLKLGSDNARETSGGFALTHSGTYALRLIDTAGLANLQPPRYTLTAEPDQPPIAAITAPGRDLTLPADAEFDLTVEAEDDIGLARGALQIRRGASEWESVQDWTIPELTVRHHSATMHVALAAFDLKVDEVLLYRAVAWDHRQPQPNMGIGRTWSITVTEPNHDPALLAAQARRLLDALEHILALQKENRSDLDYDRPEDPIRARQQQIRDLTGDALAQQRKALRPTQSVIEELQALADGPMLQAVQALADYGGTYPQRQPHKKPILDLMDTIIARLEALISQVTAALGSAEKAQEILAQLPPEEREQALKQIRDLLEKLRDFVPEQDHVIADTEELARKGKDFTGGDVQKIEQLKGTEDKWSEAFVDSVKDIGKLTEQGFADTSIANDYKEMVEQIEAASLNLTPQLIELAIPREQSGRELAESLVEEMEMWLPNTPDNLKWMMEEPLDSPEIPMVELPDQLSDLIGDLIEEQDDLNDAAEDMTSAWADSIAEGAGWAVMGGPISNFSAVGKTGNQLPDNNELSGRAGEGRSGRSQGQLVENVAKGLAGRQTPTRITNDPYEKGVVKELQQMATGGATGGGKARGAGQEGLQGDSPPPLFDQMQYMHDWQQRIRQKAEKVAGQIQSVRINLPEFGRSIELMKQAEQAAADGRYAELFKIQQMVAQNLKLTGELALRETALHVDRAHHLPPDQRRQILDAMNEPVPQEYQDAVRRYFEQLSETK